VPLMTKRRNNETYFVNLDELTTSTDVVSLRIRSVQFLLCKWPDE